jgi:HlyD family secretion protein
VRKLTTKRLGWLAAALIAASAPIALEGCKKPEQKKTEQAPRAVRVARVANTTLAGGLSSTGVLASREEAAVGSEIAGYRVSRVMADVDSWVRQGQPLVQLDDTLLRSEIARARANVAQQKALAAQAADQAKRVAGLDNEGVLSDEAIAQRRFQAQSAQAGVASLQATLQDLLTRQSRMTIRAPVSGVVMERNVRPGDISSPSTVMFRIIRDGLVELEAQVPEAELSRITAGSPAQAIVPSGATVNGTVRFVSPAVESATKLGKIRISLPYRKDLRPGGYARAVFTGLSRSAAAVPESAVRYSASGPTVMTLDAKNRANEVVVRTGQHANGWVELLQGPPLGTRVLLGGSAFVLEGDAVNAVEGAGDPTPAAKPAQPAKAKR